MLLRQRATFVSYLLFWCVGFFASSLHTEAPHATDTKAIEAADMLRAFAVLKQHPIVKALIAIDTDIFSDIDARQEAFLQFFHKYEPAVDVPEGKLVVGHIELLSLLALSKRVFEGLSAMSDLPVSLGNLDSYLQEAKNVCALLAEAWQVSKKDPFIEAEFALWRAQNEQHMQQQINDIFQLNAYMAQQQSQSYSAPRWMYTLIASGIALVCACASIESLSRSYSNMRYGEPEKNISVHHHIAQLTPENYIANFTEVRTDAPVGFNATSMVHINSGNIDIKRPKQVHFNNFGVDQLTLKEKE